MAISFSLRRKQLKAKGYKKFLVTTLSYCRSSQTVLICPPILANCHANQTTSVWSDGLIVPGFLKLVCLRRHIF